MPAAARARQSAANRVPTAIQSFGSAVAGGTNGTAVAYGDANRKKVVIQNPAGSGVTFLVGRQATLTSLNPPSSFPDAVAPGQQYVDTTPSTVVLPVWFKESAGGSASAVYYVQTVPAP